MTEPQRENWDDGENRMTCAKLHLRATTFTDLDYHLDNWARWMREKDGPEGLPEKASGGLMGYSGMDRDSDGAYARNDAWLAEHADAAISDLVPAQRAAIYTAYDLAAVWRFPRDNYEEILALARAKIRATLLRRGVVVT